MKMSEFLNMDMGELSDWIIENGNDYIAIKNGEYDRLTEENTKLREMLGSLVYESEHGFGYVDINDAKQLLTGLKEQGDE